jgi:hypothetical protein
MAEEMTIYKAATVIQAVEDTSTYLDRGEVERQENLELF